MARKNKARNKTRKTTKNKIGRPVPSNNQALVSMLNQAQEAANSGDILTATDLCQKVLTIKPDQHNALHLLGLMAYKTNNFEDADKLISSARKIMPSDPSILFNLGAVKSALKKYPEAIKLYNDAIKIKPDYDKAFGNLATVYLMAEDNEKAIYYANEAIKINPESASSSPYYNVAAAACSNLGEIDYAEQLYVKSMQLNPDDVRTYAGLGEVFLNQGKFQAAKEAYEFSQKVGEVTDKIRFNMSYVYLSLGELEKAWDGYEYGLITGERQVYRPDIPQWQGEELSDKSILVLAEQGLGDEILFSSCFKDLLEIASECHIACEIRLADLFRRSFPNAIIVPLISRAPKHIMQHQEKYPDINYWLAAGSLPGIFRKQLNQFPTTPGYLITDNDKSALWKKQLSELSGNVKVGISWKSGILTTKRAKHYTSLEDWLPILKIPGIDFINLQYDDCQSVLDDIESKYGIHIYNFDNVDLKNDIDNTSALISELDLVITIGNAVSSIASGIGTRTWKLSTNSWLMLGTDHEPWYPNTKIFPPHIPRDWGTVITKITNELQELLADSTT